MFLVNYGKSDQNQGVRKIAWFVLITRRSKVQFQSPGLTFLMSNLYLLPMDQWVLPFDAKGRIDQEEWTRGVRLALELMPAVLEGTHSNQVINARHRFMKRRYDHEFLKMEERIVSAIFGLR